MMKPCTQYHWNARMLCFRWLEIQTLFSVPFFSKSKNIVVGCMLQETRRSQRKCFSADAGIITNGNHLVLLNYLLIG